MSQTVDVTKCQSHYLFKLSDCQKCTQFAKLLRIYYVSGLQVHNNVFKFVDTDRVEISRQRTVSLENSRQ